jgi:hypothetical protein
LTRKTLVWWANDGVISNRYHIILFIPVYRYWPLGNTTFIY